MIGYVVKALYVFSIELLIMASFFVGFDNADLAQMLACTVSIVCGFGLRMVMMAASDIAVTKKLITIHGFATVFISWLAWNIWQEGTKNVVFFTTIGLQPYLIFCSFMSVSLIKTLNGLLENISNISAKISAASFKAFLLKYFLSEDKPKDKEIKP